MKKYSLDKKKGKIGILMKNLGIVFVFLGVSFIGLSGLEKILIFLAYKGISIQDMQTIINLTPKFIWSITNYTFGFGLLFFIVGLFLFFSKELRKWLAN